MLKCFNCDKVYTSNINFCSVCGGAIKQKRKDTSTLNAIISFYISIVVFIAMSYFIYQEYPNNFTVDVTLETLFIVLVIGFSLTDYKNIFALYKKPKLNIWAFIFIPITLINAFFIYYGTSYINDLVGFGSENYYTNYLYIDNSLFWAVIFIAIIPPVFEELAFRGFLFNLVSKVTSTQATIIVTSFLFALIHFSALSIIWIFPFGLFLGYLRSRYNSLLLPMLIHFIHNFTILMIDYYVYSN